MFAAGLWTESFPYKGTCRQQSVADDIATYRDLAVPDECIGANAPTEPAAALIARATIGVALDAASITTKTKFLPHWLSVSHSNSRVSLPSDWLADHAVPSS